MQRSRTLREHQDLLQKYLQKSGGGGGQAKEKKKEKITTFAPKLEQCLFVYIYFAQCLLLQFFLLSFPFSSGGY